MNKFNELTDKVLSEAYRDKLNRDIVMKLKELNGDRIGKTVLNSKGDEIKNSIVLAPLIYAVKGGNHVTATEYDEFGLHETSMTLHKDYIKQMLKL
jgi:hypothetical protein